MLMQVVFHADIEKDRGRFTMEDVVDGVVKKLLYRHPHVFAGAAAESAELRAENPEEQEDDENADA